MQLQERNEQENNNLINVENLPTFSMTEPTSISMRLRKPVLRKGDTGDAVEELQKLLRYWEYYYDSIDGIFSQYVEWAVKAFQHRVYLEEDGVVGTLTWKSLYSGAPPVPPIPVLSRGSTGKYVRLAQRTLSLHGYYSFDIDGIFGAVTEAAVTTFQTDMALGADGIVGSRTWHALSKLYH